MADTKDPAKTKWARPLLGARSGGTFEADALSAKKTKSPMSGDVPNPCKAPAQVDAPALHGSGLAAQVNRNRLVQKVKYASINQGLQRSNSRCCNLA